MSGDIECIISKLFSPKNASHGDSVLETMENTTWIFIVEKNWACIHDWLLGPAVNWLNIFRAISSDSQIVVAIALTQNYREMVSIWTYKCTCRNDVLTFLQKYWRQMEMQMYLIPNQSQTQNIYKHRTLRISQTAHQLKSLIKIFPR